MGMTTISKWQRAILIVGGILMLLFAASNSILADYDGGNETLATAQFVLAMAAFFFAARRSAPEQ